MRNVSDESQTLESIQRVARGMRHNHKCLVNCSIDLLKPELKRYQQYTEPLTLYQPFETSTRLFSFRYYILYNRASEREILSLIFYTLLLDKTH